MVDATWDLPLEKAGFPVNLHWDGISDTLPAVTPLPVIPPGSTNGIQVSEIVHRSAGERVKCYGEMRGRYTSAQEKAREEFDREFNLWLEEVRLRYPAA